MFPRRVCHRRKAGRSADSRVQILARVDYLCSRELGADILQLNGASGVDPGTVQGGSSTPPALFALGQLP